MNGISTASGENTVAGEHTVDVDEDMPFEIVQHARDAVLETLPKLSRETYTRVYRNFKDWQTQHGTTIVSNDLVLSYFHMLATKKKYKATSLWAYHSMLKASLRTFENIHIDKYKQVSAYLSARSAGYKPKKACVFAEQNIKTFIDGADELSWLDVKVVTIFGICGALRTDEFTRITVDDVKKHGDMFLVQIHETKNKWPRSFTISGSFAVFVQKFLDIRPVGLQSSDRFFTNYQRGKCTKQYIGKNKFSNMPRRVAEYLGLPEPERCTGHSFRRTSATFLANSGADIETIMRHGGWRSARCAKEYIEDSVTYKARTGNMIQGAIEGTAVPFANAPANVPFNAANNGMASTIVSIREPTNASNVGADDPLATAASNVAVKPPNTSMAASTIASINAPTKCTMNRSIPANLLVDPPRSDVAFFDPAVRDDDLVQMADCATQSLSDVAFFDPVVRDDDLGQMADCTTQSYEHEQSTQILVGNDVGGRNVDGHKSDKHVPRKSAASTVSVQSMNNLVNAVNAALSSRSFKSINFERLEHCPLHFHFGK